MTSIRLRLATVSAALAAVLHATMPDARGGARSRVYAVSVAPVRPRTPVVLVKATPRTFVRSPW